MKHFFEIIRNYYKGIIKGLILVVALAILVYIFPREAKFKYEFYKGKPWMHIDMIAENNIPIYKTESELTGEKDSILKDYKPYFDYDSSVYIMEYNKFEDLFGNTWDSYIEKKYRMSEATTGRSRLKVKLKKTRSEYLSYLKNVISFIYKKGIIEPNELLENEGESVAIYILRGNLAEESASSELFTQKKAYEYAFQQIESFKPNDASENKQAFEFFKQLNIGNFLEPNLFFNKEMSDREKQTLIDNISLTAGMVQAGERIISRGEVVTSDKYRVLESLKKDYESGLGTTFNHMMIIFGQIIIIGAMLAILYLFLFHFRRDIFLNNAYTFFIMLLLIIFVLIIRLAASSQDISVYFIPLVIVPIIIRTFFDSRLALFIHMIMIMITGFLVPNSFEFIFMSFSVGVVAIFTMTNAYRRGILFLTAVFVSLSYSILYLGLGVIQEGNLQNVNWLNFAWFAGNGILVLLSYPLIFIFEKTFGFLSDATLLELADTNQPLLRELSEKAPGTFQHSLQVANLSEEACRIVGGNPMLVRTGALYHDIGKMKDPLYFVENQSSGFNPHDNLNFEDSAAIIIGHVTKGVEIAGKNKLPQPLIDFILTHHGTSKVQYFYRSFIKSYPEEIVDDLKFSYPGPKPSTMEMAVLMMADSVEAASRSLKNIDSDTINSLVEKIITLQFEDGQFNETPITLVDITRIKKIFKKRLTNIYHARIEYPDKPEK